MSAHCRTRRVTHLTLIDARVVLGFMEIIPESYEIVPERGLMIYLLIKLININTYIYLFEINKS
jgi:hypothetical protein